MGSPIFQCKLSEKSKIVTKLEIKNSGFLLIDPPSIKFIEDMCSLKKIPNISELLIKKSSLELKNISNYQNYLYPKILNNELDLLFKNFNNDYNPLTIKDFFIIDNDLFYVKMVNLNGFLKVNSTKDVIEEDEHSFLNDSWVYNKMGSTRNMACCMGCKPVHEGIGYNLFEICNCDKLIHLKCFQSMFLEKTKVEYFENYFKMTVRDFKCFECGKRYESFSIWDKKVKCFLNLPDLDNNDNIIMLVELNKYNLENDIFVGYFLKSEKQFKKYKFKDKIKYYTKYTNFSFKALNKRSKLYKEKGYEINFKNLSQSVFFLNKYDLTFKKMPKNVLAKSIKSIKNKIFKKKFNIKKINNFGEVEEFKTTEQDIKISSISMTNYNLKES